MSLKLKVITEKERMERLEAKAVLQQKPNSFVEKILKEPVPSQWHPLTGQKLNIRKPFFILMLTEHW